MKLPFSFLWRNLNEQHTVSKVFRLCFGEEDKSETTISYEKITHRHLLLREDPPYCPHCHFSVLTIRHLLTDCPGLRHLYRHSFNSSSPNLTTLLGENPHAGIINFLKEANFYNYIWFYSCLTLLLLLLFCTYCFILCCFKLIWMWTPSRYMQFPLYFNF